MFSGLGDVGRRKGPGKDTQESAGERDRQPAGRKEKPQGSDHL